jgi:hypothetical protein
VKLKRSDRERKHRTDDAQSHVMMPGQPAPDLVFGRAYLALGLPLNEQKRNK